MVFQSVLTKLLHNGLLPSGVDSFEICKKLRDTMYAINRSEKLKPTADGKNAKEKDAGEEEEEEEEEEDNNVEENVELRMENVAIPPLNPSDPVPSSWLPLHFFAYCLLGPFGGNSDVIFSLSESNGPLSETEVSASKGILFYVLSS